MEKRAAHRFLTDRSGLAAVEFALILPMMLVLLLGSIEIISFLQADRRAENTAVSLADVVSQDDEITNAELTGIWAALEPLEFPDDARDLDVRITSIAFDASGDPTATWAERCGGIDNNVCGVSQFSAINDDTDLDASDFPEDMRVPSTTLVRVELDYEYTPRLAFFFLEDGFRLGHDNAPRTLKHVAFRRARLSDEIDRNRT
ncbi:MAG: TadE/TadG family type IV pilus assembly protein [Caulobacterales bacterium]